VDFKKAFDTVPIDKLWNRMEELGIPYGNDIGVKQGCLLSPTLFGLYIDKLKAWLSKMDEEGVHLAGYVVKLLLYADDLILISKTTHRLKEHIKALKHFCHEVGMQVNITKTKIMIVSLNRKDKPITFLF
jgi:hypothetical protein